MNSVNITGILKDNIDEHYRYLEYALPYYQDSILETRNIITRYWTKDANTRLIQLPLNTRVAIHGHLDIDEKFGTILLVEQLEVINSK